MNSATIAVHWHDDGHPVYSVSFQPCATTTKSPRLATAGGDNNVRMWHLNYASPIDDSSVEYLSTLRKHTQAVNAVRFDPSGEMLATAGDDGMLIVWSRADSITVEFGHQDDDIKESWSVKLLHNTQLEIYDICWSPDSRYIATGSMDHITKIYCVTTGQKLCDLANHSHYVQGVAWDPLGEYLATQGADRALHIYSLKPGSGAGAGVAPLTIQPTLFFKVVRAELPTSKLLTSGYTLSGLATETVLSSTEGLPRSPRSPPLSSHRMNPPSQKHVHQVVTSPKRKTMPSESLAAVAPSTAKLIKRPKKSSLLYHSETLQSFFRRLAFSPDGTLLLTPLGIFKNDDTSDEKDGPDTTCLNTVYIYIRSGLNRPPVCHLPGLPKPAVAIAFNPIFYELASSERPPVFKLPYKMVFAVATQDAVYFYDTQNLLPIGSLTNLHYLTITDLCWDYDGQSIIVSSAEGFCSVIAFDEGKLGRKYNPAGKGQGTKTEVETRVPAKDASNESENSTGNAKQNSLEISQGPPNASFSIPPRKVEGASKKVFAKPGAEASQHSTPLQMPFEMFNGAPLGDNSENPILVNDDQHQISGVTGTGEAQHESTPITLSVLSQFIAEPVVVGSTAHSSAAAIEDSHLVGEETSQKKRRIAPTLIDRK